MSKAWYKQKKIVFFTLISMTSMMVVFQNCSPTGFNMTDPTTDTSMPITKFEKSTTLNYIPITIDHRGLKNLKIANESCDFLERGTQGLADTTLHFNTCLNFTNRKLLTLRAGVTYVIRSPIKVFSRDILIRSSDSNIVCDQENWNRCPVIKADDHFDEDDPGLVVILPTSYQLSSFASFPNIKIRNISIQGERHTKRRRIPGLVIVANNVEVSNSAVVNVSGGAAVAINQNWYLPLQDPAIVHGSGALNTQQRNFQNIKLLNNFIGHNGYHEANRWTDGLTIQDGTNLVIKGNHVHNNTDVGIIFGGCKSCQVSENRITHDDSFIESSFAALMIHSWPDKNRTDQTAITSGDFSGSTIQLNKIECGAKKRCGYGLLVGTGAWRSIPELYPSEYTRAFGGSIKDNSISNAMIGMAIDETSGNMEFSNNMVYRSGGLFGGLDLARDCTNQARNIAFGYPARLIGKASRQFYKGPAEELALFSEMPDIMRCIPNHNLEPTRDWIQNSTQVRRQKVSEQVETLYGLFLKRAPDAEGKLFWTNQIFSNQRTLENVVVFFINSSESLNRLTDKDFVLILYKDLLGREPDAGGFNFWTEELRSGRRNRTSVVKGFLTAPEFARHSEKLFGVVLDGRKM